MNYLPEHAKPDLDLPKHLSYWQDDLDIEQFKKWCGSYNTPSPFKVETRQRVMLNNYKSILDCGAGLFSEYFGFKHEHCDQRYKHRYHIEYVATEITKKYVEYGQKLGINVVLCAIDNLPFEDDSFDCCLCFDVLNHQLEYEKSIKELIRVVKKEVVISFFKPFEEKAVKGKHYHGLYEIRHSDYGMVEERIVKNDETICLYSFFNEKKLRSFLDKLNINYRFDIASDKKTMLYLLKK